jgi:hypothetical protein
MYKADDTSFIAPKIQTPGTAPPFPHIFSCLEESPFYSTILHSLHTLQSLCKYTKGASFPMDVFRNCSISTNSDPFRNLPGCFQQTDRWCCWQILGSHILAFLNSVSLPSRRRESICEEVNKLQVLRETVVISSLPIGYLPLWREYLLTDDSALRC